MSNKKVKKTDHAGAKNGGSGHWGLRIEAKELGKRVRRANNKKILYDAEKEPRELLQDDDYGEEQQNHGQD